MKIQCRKCLLEDMNRDEYIKSLQEYITSYPSSERVDDETYNMRLDICKECDELSNGMCAKCGCFVQLRALKTKACCASEKKLW
ncbi:MAG: hypothetical protein IJO29_01145 [Oscillospiraceae bacterium]|nr:hypothetical protein [Oscillospiraceae bacterium]